MLRIRNNTRLFTRIVGLCWIVMYMSFYPISLGQVIHDKLTAESLLESVLAAEMVRPAIAADINIVSKLSQGDKTETHRYVSQYRKDKSRIDVAVDTYYSDLSLGNDRMTSQMRSIWDGDTFVHRNQRPFYDSLYAVSLEEKHGHNISIKTWAAPWLNGIAQGDYKSIAQIMRDSGRATLMQEKEEIDGFLCYLIESKTERGDYKIWVDAKHGFLARKIIVRREGNHLHWGEPVGDKIIEMEISNTDIKDIGESYMATESTLKIRGIKRDKVIFDDSYNARLSNIELNPNFEEMGAFVMDRIPKEAKVTHLDFPGIRYIWSDAGAIIYISLDDIFDEIDSKIKNSTANTLQNNIKDSGMNASPSLPAEQMRDLNTQEIELNNFGNVLAERNDNRIGYKTWWIVSFLVIVMGSIIYFILRKCFWDLKK